MTLEWPILSAIIWLPIIGGFLVLFIGDKAANASRWVALSVAIITFLLSTPLYFNFDVTTKNMQFLELVPWIPAFDVFYYLGVDGIEMPSTPR